MAEQNTIVVTGGTGFIGASVVKRLVESNPDKRIVVVDIAEHPRIAAIRDKVTFVKADLGAAGVCEDLITEDVDTVFHFASLVSAGSEQNFEAGLHANIYASLNLLEACRTRGGYPRFVFAATLASFGGKTLADEINDYTYQHSQSSYGVAKTVVEQLLNDYSRKGFIDGRGIRLPAIIVRNKPNTAASTYTSCIIREPIAGNDYVCPVTPETYIPVLSIGKCVDIMMKLRELDKSALGDYRCFNSPCLSTSAGELASAVRNCGAEGLGKITFEPDEVMMSIIKTPKVIHYDRAKALGLLCDESVEAIVADYLQQKSEQ